METAILLRDESAATSLKEHPFAADLGENHFDILMACAEPFSIRAGEYVWRQGQRADFLLLICSGDVALEIAVPLNAPVRIDTVGAGEVLGWSWLLPPYRWHFDARAISPVHAFRLNGQRLRERCEIDPSFGYAVFRRFAPVIARRLEHAQQRLLDL